MMLKIITVKRDIWTNKPIIFSATIKELSKNINSLAEIWAASLKNMTEIEKKIDDISE